MTEREFSSAKINILRPCLLLLVVFNHCTAGMDMINGGGNSLISNYIQIYLGKTLTPAAVSTFFVISGYLYFANVTDFNRDVYITKTKKRIKSLIIPYLLWNLAGIIIISIKGSSLNFDSIGAFLVNFGVVTCGTKIHST